MKKIIDLLGKGNKNIQNKIVLMAVLISILIFCVVFFSAHKPLKLEDEEMTFTTNKGNVIETEYKDFGKFYMKIPKDFELLSDELLKIKYPLGNIPKKAYSNEDTTINIVFNKNEISLNGASINEYVEVIKKTYTQMGYYYYYFQYDINGIEIHTISMITSAIDTKIDNYIAIFEIDNEIMMLNFNCIHDLAEEWNPVGKFLVESIRKK